MKFMLLKPDWLLILLFVLLSSCFSRTAMMTRDSFDDIAIGADIDELRGCIGKPYAICCRSDDIEEYEYIERFKMGAELISENHYFLVVRNGQIIAKRMTRDTPPAYDLIYQEDPNNN